MTMNEKVRFLKSDGGAKAAGYGHETTDCAVRAIAIVTGASYKRAYHLLKKAGRKDGQGFHLYLWLLDMKSKAIFKHEFVHKSRLYHYTVKQFIKRKLKGTYIGIISGHVTVYKNGVFLDLWRPNLRTRFTGVWRVVRH
jgi:hypothetical protein